MEWQGYSFHRILLQFKDSLDTAANLDEQLMEKVRRLSAEASPTRTPTPEVMVNGSLKPDATPQSGGANEIVKSCCPNGVVIANGPPNGLLKPNGLCVNSNGPSNSDSPVEWN